MHKLSDIIMFADDTTIFGKRDCPKVLNNTKTQASYLII